MMEPYKGADKIQLSPNLFGQEALPSKSISKDIGGSGNHWGKHWARNFSGCFQLTYLSLGWVERWMNGWVMDERWEGERVGG